MALRRARSLVSRPIRQIGVTPSLHGNLNGKDTTFDAGFAAAGVGRNPKATRVVITCRTSRSIASRMSALKIIGPYVYCPRALLMPTPRLAPHSTSKAFCVAIMI
jgi:hypothetical protein